MVFTEDREKDEKEVWKSEGTKEGRKDGRV